MLSQDEKSFLRAAFNIVEYLTEMELRVTSKNLIMNYIKQAPGITPAEKARHAIFRYTNVQLDELNTIQEKNRHGKLSNLDHLILKLEYEAGRLYKNSGP